jgi:FkbM family methyltransferase
VWRRRVARPEPLDDPWSEVLTVLFPAGLDATQMAKVRAAVGDSPPTASSARVALGALDQQTSNSPVTIRWGANDLAYADVAGVRLALDRADASVSIQIAEGAYEPHVEATLDRLLEPGDVFVDVGANVGYHTVRASRSVGPDGRVVAVEANPENARLIAHTIELNAITNIELVPVALSSRRGHVVFGTHVGSNGGFLDAATSASGRGTLVPTFALDDLGLERVSVVKIDVEGAEALVVDGATEVVRRDRPSFVMEFSQEMTGRVSQREPRGHLDRFVDWGYSIAIIDRATSVPREMSVDDLLAEWGDVLRIEDLLLVPLERTG